jgi:hypothetical protein
MNEPRHRAETVRMRRRRTQQISWSVVAYMVAIVLAKHYFGVDLSPL